LHTGQSHMCSDFFSSTFLSTQQPHVDFLFPIFFAICDWGGVSEAKQTLYCVVLFLYYCYSRWRHLPKRRFVFPSLHSYTIHIFLCLNSIISVVCVCVCIYILYKKFVTFRVTEKEDKHLWRNRQSGQLSVAVISVTHVWLLLTQPICMWTTFLSIK
jgi:hypothetical protein